MGTNASMMKDVPHFLLSTLYRGAVLPSHHQGILLPDALGVEADLNSFSRHMNSETNFLIEFSVSSSIARSALGRVDYRNKITSHG